MARRSLLAALLALLLGGGSAAVASRLPVAQVRAFDLHVIPASGAARWASLGHPLLVANLWWLRAVQYMGDPLADGRGWDRLHPALDLVTDLDPRHGYAYQVGGNVLSSVGRIDEANRLLEKGARNVPDRYILPFQRAVNAFLYDGDYAAAGAWFERAARTPGAPASRMRDYAAVMYVKGQAWDHADGFLAQLYESAEDGESRKAIKKQLDQARLERAAAQVEAAAERYRARHGAYPVWLPALVAEGLLDAIPADPFGGELRLDADGRVRSTVHPTRYTPPLTDAERRALLQEQDRRVQGAQQAMP